eukprot:CAMPEP_0198534504 /NCGR_PEP_ID=MMETSP1462-20131121/36484_1 /TAXON_ID=1333877 /ORGANISM="Brandtodinium nutriculum, Strain RCC3387" /LENGTH=37 /DNA_ID= /DNA_START= /DNA_END= /DNA_ORIENTATION=
MRLLGVVALVQIATVLATVAATSGGDGGGGAPQEAVE